MGKTEWPKSVCMTVSRICSLIHSYLMACLDQHSCLTPYLSRIQLCLPVLASSHFLHLVHCLALGVWHFQALRSPWCGSCKCLLRVPGSSASITTWLSAIQHYWLSKSCTLCNACNHSESLQLCKPWLGRHTWHPSLRHIQSIPKFCPLQAKLLNLPTPPTQWINWQRLLTFHVHCGSAVFCCMLSSFCDPGRRSSRYPEHRRWCGKDNREHGEPLDGSWIFCS